MSLKENEPTTYQNDVPNTIKTPPPTKSNK